MLRVISHPSGFRARAASVLTASLVGLLLLVSNASAASRPTVAVIGQPIATGAFGRLPYAQTKLPVELSVTYHGVLSGGAKLQLRSRASVSAPYLATHTAVKLHGAHATLHVSAPIAETGSYEIVLISGRHVLATSRAVSVFWLAPPPGIFVQDSDGVNALSSPTTGGPCASLTPTGNRCEDGAAPGEVLSNVSGSSQLELPPKWTVKVLFNGQLVCMTSQIQGTCNSPATVPADTGSAASYPLTAELISPAGATTVATLNITVFS